MNAEHDRKLDPAPAAKAAPADPDVLIRFAVDRLSLQADGWRSLVRDLAQLWPKTPALELSYVLVSAAEIVAGQSDEKVNQTASRAAYRLAALIALDVYAMQLMDRPSGTAADLHRYWTDVDPYFLRL